MGSAAAVASLPLFASFAGTVGGGWLADWLINVRGVSRGRTRKLLYIGCRGYYVLCGIWLAQVRRAPSCSQLAARHHDAYDAFGVFGTTLPSKIGIFHSIFRKVVLITRKASKQQASGGD